MESQLVARCGCIMHAYCYGPSVCISEKHENQSSVLEVWTASQSSGFLISSVSGVWIASQSSGFVICTVWGGGGGRDMLAILFLKVLWSSRSGWFLIPLWQWRGEPADDTADWVSVAVSVWQCCSRWWRWQGGTQKKSLRQMERG